MPLRKQGNIIPIGAALLALAAMPAAANAWSLSPTTTTTTTTTTAPSPDTTPIATADGCTTLATKKAFSKFSDDKDYYLAPGGSFESGTPAWKLSGGAKIVSGNESLGVQSGSKALELPVGATATSPNFCVDETNPTFRFASKVSSLDGGYEAIVIYRDKAGAVTKRQFTSSALGDYYNGATAWNPSDDNPLALEIPLTGAGATSSVQIQFVGTTKAYGIFVASKATIDSVMIDPYRRG